MSSSITEQLQMLGAASALGIALGIGNDLRWFLSRALKLPLHWALDVLCLPAAALLVFTLFQFCGGSARLDLLCFVLGSAILYEALLGAHIRDILAHFALL